MPFVTLSSGLTLVIPTSGTKNWATVLKNSSWQKISEHGHTGSGDGNQMVTNSYADGSITLEKLANNAGFNQYDTVNDAGGGATVAINFDNGSIQFIDLDNSSGDVSVTLSNPTKGGRYKLIITQGPTPRQVSWPGAVTWPQGQSYGVNDASTLTISLTDNYVDMITLYYDGTSYYGSFDLDYQ